MFIRRISIFLGSGNVFCPILDRPYLLSIPPDDMETLNLKVCESNRQQTPPWRNIDRFWQENTVLFTSTWERHMRPARSLHGRYLVMLSVDANYQFIETNRIPKTTSWSWNPHFHAFSTCALRFFQPVRGLRFHRCFNHSHACLARPTEWYWVIMTGEIGNV